jgi:hypothetical protein
MSRNQCLLRYERVSFWVGILGDQLLGPVVVPNRLTGAVYHSFLVDDLPVHLEHVPLHQRQHMWFMLDGAPPHFLRIVRPHLNQALDERGIGRGGPVSWPALSPDLNPPDFWLWGHLKTLVYSALINYLRGIAATSRQCLSGESSATRNCKQNSHLCATKSWKLCWKAWEPHRASAVEITQASPISQQALVSV